MVANSPHVLVLRDEDTVAALSGRLATARRIVLVGNGGIALELANALQGVEVWFHNLYPESRGCHWCEADAGLELASSLQGPASDLTCNFLFICCITVPSKTNGACIAPLDRTPRASLRLSMPKYRFFWYIIFCLKARSC